MSVTDVPGADTAPRDRPDLLERVARVLTSTLELGEVLHLLSETTLEAVADGRECSVSVLVVDGRLLRPAAAVGTSPDETRFQAFMAMPPIELDDAQWSVLCAGEPLLLADAGAASLVPREWLQAFRIGALALFPINAGGRPLGVMAVDWPEPQEFAEGRVRTLSAIAAYAAIAVRNARHFDSTRRWARLQEALANGASILASPMEPDDVAARLADAFVDLVGARLSVVALFDAGRKRLTTIASRGGPTPPCPFSFGEIPTRITERLWDAWAQSHKPPVEFDDDPWLATVAGGREAGAIRYLMLPLVLMGHTRGVVLLGIDEHGLRIDERSAAEMLAGVGAAALERHEFTARLDRQVDVLSGLYKTSAALAGAGALGPLLAEVCQSMEELLHTSHCSVNLLNPSEPGALVTAAARGITWFAHRTDSLAAPKPSVIRELISKWAESGEPIVYRRVDERLVSDPGQVPDAIRTVALFPMLRGNEVLGVIAAGFDDATAPKSNDLEAGRALADLAAAAADRAALDRSLALRLRQLETLDVLSDVVAGAADLDSALRQLNQLIQPELGVRLGSVAIVEGRTRDAVNARSLDADERSAVASWRQTVRKGGDARPRPVSGGLLVPIARSRRVVGVLRVVTEEGRLDSSDDDVLIALGAGCAEVVHRAALQRDLAHRERQLTIAAERERIARDLHDSVAQAITAIGLRLTVYREEAPSAEWSTRFGELLELAREGGNEIRDAIQALLFLDARRQGIATSLRELTRRFETTTGVGVQLSLRGSFQTLPPPVDDALFRVAHEALVNVDHHAQASAVSVAVTVRSREVVLRIKDDGVGLTTPGKPEGRHFGVEGMHQRMAAVGGSLTIANDPAGGVLVEARVPLAGQAPRRSRRP